MGFAKTAGSSTLFCNFPPMKTKYRLFAGLAALFLTSGLSAETTLLLEIAFGFRYVPPSNVTVSAGEYVSVMAPGLGSGQWFKNNQPVAGAVSPTLVIPSISASDAGAYFFSPSGPGLPAQGTQLLLLNVGPVQRFLNLSSRAIAGAGEQTLIAGFVVSGPEEKRVLIRAIGPSLAKFGLTGFLREPVIKIYDSAGNLYLNDYVYAAVLGVKEAAIADATLKTGAFALIANSKDAVELRPFPAGAYTIHVTSNDGTTGVALMELYEVPSNSGLDIAGLTNVP
jgi:hypothetical protein